MTGSDTYTSFVGWDANGIGWRVESMETIVGSPLPNVSRLAVIRGEDDDRRDAQWVLRGRTGPVQYISTAEEQQLSAIAPPLARPKATSAALLPIRKSPAWWALPDAERTRIFGEASKHVPIASRYVPAVARRLYYSRELGEPFDFLTWFEFAPNDAASFDMLLRELRDTEEWAFVDREIDIRLTRAL